MDFDELINDKENKESIEDYGYLKGPNEENKKVFKKIKPTANIDLESGEEEDFSLNKVKKEQKPKSIKKDNKFNKRGEDNIIDKIHVERNFDFNNFNFKYFWKDNN